MDARRLALLEKITNAPFRGWDGSSNPIEAAASILNTTYLTVQECIYAELLAETRLKDIYSISPYSATGRTFECGSVRRNYAAHSNELGLILERAIPRLQSLISMDEPGGRILLKEFVRTVQGFQDQEKIGSAAFQKAFAQYGSDLACIGPKRIIRGEAKERNVLYGSPGPDMITGGSGNDYISGGLCDDELYGSEGNDALYGDYGNDLLDGGPGNDSLFGGPGKDTYVFGKGYGFDYIWDNEPGNIVQFKEGIKASAPLFRLINNNDLWIILNSKDKLVIGFWQGKGFYTIDKFIFADGTILAPPDVLKLVNESKNSFHWRSIDWESYSFIDLYLLASMFILSVLVILNVMLRRRVEKLKILNRQADVKTDVDGED